MPDREQAMNLFDLRRIIGGLFTVLGLLLVILGLTESQAEIDRAAGVNINLWAGLGMLVLGLLFLLWAFARPLSAQLDSEDLGGPPGSDGEGAVGGAEPGRQ
jgi:xanthine/uracil/vitamin C permease (AzgA family)